MADEAIKPYTFRSIIEGIQHFGLAADGADLRDLMAAYDRLAAENTELRSTMIDGIKAALLKDLMEPSEGMRQAWADVIVERARQRAAGFVPIEGSEKTWQAMLRAYAAENGIDLSTPASNGDENV
jgi:hypothetical protein